MAATLPRPSSPPPAAAPKSGHALQISPNLEALLEHDELARRNSNSSTHAPGFPISLPPPPPRKAHGARKTGQREQELPFPTTRSREGQGRWALGSDFWPDALPAALPPDGGAAGQSPLASSSRPATPNPYLNPTPVLTPILTQPLNDPDGAQTPKQPGKAFPIEPHSDSSRSPAEPQGRPSPSAAFNKVEKILWLGRDSLSLLSGSASSLRRHDSDRRNDRAGYGDTDAVQVRRIRQVSVPPAQHTSQPAFSLGDTNTATLSARSAASYVHALQQRSNVDLSETASARSCSIDFGPTDRPASARPLPTAHLPPRLSLPLPSMSYDSSRPKSVDGVTGHDYLSFFDFCSSSPSDDPNMCNFQDKSREACPSRRQPRSISIPSPSLYSLSCHNHSATSLASMRFAPPSPTSLAVQQTSPVHSPLDSTTSVALSAMEFAPPSPSVDHIPSTALQSLSGPPSPYSPLEFAPTPGFPLDVMDTPSLATASELASERASKFKPAKRSVSLSPRPARQLLSPLPPTTNRLDANVRADRIRRNRKLARVFGRAPGTDESVLEPSGTRVSKKSHSPSLTALLTKQKNHRHAASVAVPVRSPDMNAEPFTPWQTDDLWSADGRRHSIPLTTGSCTLYVDNEQDGESVKVPRRGHNVMDSPESASTRSFIDLSDDDASDLNFLAPHQQRHQSLHHSSSTPSLVESLDFEAQAEADRRRKREKLARLHRFLGSRVPPEAVIGNVFGPPLPPPAIPEESNREHRLRRHKNAPSDAFDRGKGELDEKEKALNVRRALKMERLFGAPPPQTLFHTRPGRPTVPISQPASPTSFNPYVLTVDIPSSSRNPNQSAYVGKTLRRGRSDSSRCLLPHLDDTPQPSPPSFAPSFADSFAGSMSGYQHVLAQSSVYLNYQHSLNSLIDIIDRDDRRSLVELHRFLHGDVEESPLNEDVPLNSRRVSTSSSFRSERRHSLPSKASMSSLSSELYEPPEVARFQIRRRRAAKLTNFFGVDYHELIHDILESIEKGVEEERRQGTLQPQEAEVLMHRVRSLRAAGDVFP